MNRIKQAYRKINLFNNSDYKEAYIGSIFLAFKNNKQELVMAEEDREPLLWLEEFYRTKLKEYKLNFNFRFFRNITKKGKNKFFGLPDELFETLNFSNPIVNQIKFVPNLSNLKKEVYFEYADNNGCHPYTDDFKLYLFKHGIYFVQEETIPFIKGEVRYPVFIDERRLPADIKALIDQCDFDFFTINFNDARKLFIDNCYKEIDAIPFERKLLHFVDYATDKEIKELASKIDIGAGLYNGYMRRFVASIINIMFDKYSFEVLNRVTGKLSFLTPVKIETDKTYQVLSSFDGEMYSTDGENYYFNLKDKDALLKQTKHAFKEIKKRDGLSLYKYLCLPYAGYKYVKDKTFSTPKKFISALPFRDDISISTSYLSPKRCDLNYSFLSGKKQHNFVFLLRWLSNRGIDYIYYILGQRRDLLDYDPDTYLTLQIFDEKREGMLSLLFDEPTPLSGFLFSSYEVEHLDINLNRLYESLKRIDEASSNRALSYFYRCFNDKTLRSATIKMLKAFDCRDELSDSLLSFMEYVLFVPFKAADNEFRTISVKNNDQQSLLALDGYRNLDESFEPSLMYPYVSFGMNYYAFRKNYFSKPYLCSCQKESVITTINYFTYKYEKYFGKNHARRELNNYVTMFAGFPKKLIASLNFDEELIPQLEFKDHICHICQHSTPCVYNLMFENEGSQINHFTTYGRSFSAEKGVFFADRTFTGQYINKNDYKILLAFDKDKIEKRFLPYTDLRKRNLLALLASFSIEQFGTQFFLEYISDFLDLSDQEIFDALTSVSPLENSENFDYYRYIFSEISNILLLAKSVYLVDLIKRKVPYLSSTECLNIDHNDKLPLPYVHLGRIFNAYSEDVDSDEVYLCECEKETIRLIFNKFNVMYQNAGLNPVLRIYILFGYAGLPYIVTYKYIQKYGNIITYSVDEIIEQLNFKPGICRRCTSHSHAAFDGAFYKAYPLREGMIAERTFALNKLAHHHISVIETVPLIQNSIDDSELPDLNSTYNQYFPIILPLDSEGALWFKQQLNFDEEKLTILYEAFKPRLLHASTDNKVLFKNVLFSTFKNNLDVFFDYFREEPSNSTLRDSVFNHFPDIKTIIKDEKTQDEVCSIILIFIPFLFENIIDELAKQEENFEKEIAKD